MLMEVQHERLYALDKILTEFYNDRTTNERKRQIEIELNKFKLRYESWKECCYYIEISNNVYVHMFSLTVLEDVIIRKWTHVLSEDKKFLLNKLKQFVSLHRNTTIIVHKKIIKLIVDVARSDWPHNYPEFFADIINLLLCSSTLDLGLVFIQLCCDELITPCDDICFNRKDELKRSFLQHVPQLFHILRSNLQHLVNIADINLADKTLNSLCQLFSWVPISSLYSIELLTSVYPFLYNDSRTQALSVLNEILYKNCVPMNEVYLIISICQQISAVLLKTLNMDLNNVASNEENYITKLLESVRLILSTHWHRIEANNEISSISELMSSFLHFTFRMPFTDQYYQCLEIWCTFLDYLKMRDPEHIAKYEELVIPSLMELVVNKFLSRQDLYLAHFNSYTENEDGSDNEYSEFLEYHSKLIGKIVDVSPDGTSSGVVTVWKESAVFYLRLVENQAMTNLSPADMYQLHKFIVNTQILAVIYSYLGSVMSECILNESIRMVILGNRCCLNDQVGSFSCVPQQFKSYLIHAHHELLVGLIMWLPYHPIISNTGEVLPDLLITCYPFLVSKNIKQNPKLVRAIVHVICHVMKHNTNSLYFQPLLTDPSFNHLSKEIRLTLHCSLFNWILNHKIQPDDQQISFLTNLIQIAVLKDEVDFNSAASIIHHSKPKNAACKKVVFQIVEHWLQQIVMSETLLLEDPSKCVDMMTFFAECFLVLREYMNNYTFRAVRLFLECLFRPTWLECTNDGLETIMKVLTIVLEKGEDIANLITYVIHISIEQINKEKFGQYLSQGVKFGIYQLLSSILLYNWKHITIINDENPDFVNLDSILKVFLDFVNQDGVDINNVVYVLKGLETVNEKWKLYHKEFFREKYLQHFQQILMGCLITKSYDLLSENIITQLFNMASVDFTSFFRNFLMHFLEQLSDLEIEQKKLLRQSFKEDTDLPSFQTMISRFINDVRYYRMINTSTFKKH